MQLTMTDDAARTPASRADQSERWRTVTLSNNADHDSTGRVADSHGDDVLGAMLAAYVRVVYGVGCSVEIHGCVRVAYFQLLAK